MRVDTARLGNIDELFTAMSDRDDDYRYSVAWIDLMASGRHLGRSVLTRADHAALDDLGRRASTQPLAYSPRELLSVPPVIPSSGLLSRPVVAAFNEAWFRKAPVHRDGELTSLSGFFHPLDAVGGWNRLYGRRGFLQYQFVVPFGREDVMRRVIEEMSYSRLPCFLAVLKRFGAANQAPLSFPLSGWTLALDVPAMPGVVTSLFHRLDWMIIEAGGRHYFAKDAHTTPEIVSAGYPRLDEWKRIRNAVDPTGKWSSDLGRRLGLLDPSGAEVS